ncbi:MAG TPA: hypothetical protein VEP90_03745 [Methylomirabilota bacterium]|nr:hypothetical protein [Methylomirabilota bacterium]
MSDRKIELSENETLTLTTKNGYAIDVEVSFGGFQIMGSPYPTEIDIVVPTLKEIQTARMVSVYPQ